MYVMSKNEHTYRKTFKQIASWFTAFMFVLRVHSEHNNGDCVYYTNTVGTETLHKQSIYRNMRESGVADKPIC